MSQSNLTEIKAYYNKHTIGKLNDFLYLNPRVERAWSTLVEWQHKKPERIMEIGCGIGDIAWRASNYWPDSIVFAIDISEDSINTGEKLFNKTNLKFIRSDSLDQIRFEDSKKFDLIYLIDVFEHIPIEERKFLFDLLKENLHEKGLIFLSCPTIHHQNWLKENFDDMQPIDLNITLKDLSEMSDAVSKRILLYKEVSVWHLGDYLHVIFGKRDFFDQIPLIDRQKSAQRLYTQIKKKISSKLKNKKTIKQFSFNKRKKLILDILGADALKKIDEYKL